MLVRQHPALGLPLGSAPAQLGERHLPRPQRVVPLVGSDAGVAAAEGFSEACLPGEHETSRSLAVSETGRMTVLITRPAFLTHSIPSTSRPCRRPALPRAPAWPPASRPLRTRW